MYKVGQIVYFTKDTYMQNTNTLAFSVDTQYVIYSITDGTDSILVLISNTGHLVYLEDVEDFITILH